MRGSSPRMTPHLLLRCARQPRAITRILWSAPGAPSSDSASARSRKVPRARGTLSGSTGPTGLDASRHRGLSKLITASPPVPRRPARGVFRFAPRSSQAAGRFMAQWHSLPHGGGTGVLRLLMSFRAHGPPEPPGATSTRREVRGLDRRTGKLKAPHLRRPRTGHRSRPVWRLQTPRYEGGMEGI